MTRATVVVPTRDRPADLARLMNTLAGQRTQRSFDVVLVDDGSEPPVARETFDAELELRVVRRGGGGPAAARNAGAAAASGGYLLFTDDDTEVAPTWVEAACEFLDGHVEHVGVEGPVGSPPFDPLYEQSLENGAPGAYWTCNIAYRRDAFEQLGGFLEDFPDPHCEDLDLAYRAEGSGRSGSPPRCRSCTTRARSLCGAGSPARGSRERGGPVCEAPGTFRPLGPNARAAVPSSRARCTTGASSFVPRHRGSCARRGGSPDSSRWPRSTSAPCS